MSTPDAAAPPSAGSGVIHDIGYRHYDGPRLGRASLRRALFVESLRGAYGLGRSARTKVIPMIVLAMMCVPALVLAAIVALTPIDEILGGYGSYLPNLQLLVVIFVAAQAPASVSRDLRFKVTSLYFSRPLHRLDYVAAKYAALAVAVFVLVALPLTILVVGALLAELPAAAQLAGYGQAVVGAAVAAVLVAGIAVLIASVTPRRGLGVAAIVTVLLVLGGVQGAVMGIASSQGADGVAGWSTLLSPFTLVAALQDSLLGSDSFYLSPPGTAGDLALVAVALLVAVGCFALLLLRYRKVSVS